MTVNFLTFWKNSNAEKATNPNIELRSQLIFLTMLFRAIAQCVTALHKGGLSWMGFSARQAGGLAGRGRALCLTATQPPATANASAHSGHKPQAAAQRA